MNRLRRIINNTIISLLGQAVTWASTLLLTIAYGRFLGAFAFGELYLATTFVSLLGTPVDYGYTNQIIREVAQKPSMATRYFSNALLIKLGSWLIMYVLMLFTSLLLGNSPEVYILIVICGFDLLNTAVANTFAALHCAFERTIFPAVGNILENGLAALVGILLLRAGAGVQVMAVVLVIGSFINAIWQAIWYFRTVGADFVIDPALIREIVRKNIPFLIYGIMMVGYTRIDTVLLALMTNSTVVGWYGAANRIFDVTNQLPAIVINSIMYPIFSKLSVTSDADLKLAFEKSVNFLLFCSIPITTVLIIAAPNIIGFLYAQSGFSQSIPVLQALAPGVIFQYINFAFFSILLSKKLDGKIPILALISLIFNLIFNYIFIHFYQHIGAGIVSSLTELLLCVIGVIFIPKNLLPLGSLRVAFKTIIASLITSLVILPLHTLHILVILPIAILVYLVASVLLSTIPKEDYQTLYQAVRHKAQPISDSGSSDQETYYADALSAIELAITMKLPAIGVETIQTRLMKAIQVEPMQIRPMKLPAKRIETMQTRPMKAIRVEQVQHPSMNQTVNIPVHERRKLSDSKMQ